MTHPLALLAVRRAEMRAAPQVSGWVPLPHQTPPDGDWLYWLLLAGRGAGKTMAGAHAIDTAARHSPIRVGIIAPTLGDARAICVEGETGILAVNPDIRFNRSWGELSWPNGSKAQLFGAFTPEDAQRLRGPQHHWVWAEELGSWRQQDEAWDMMRFGLRLGTRPRVVITTTPRPSARIKKLLADPACVVVRAHTDDNPHLAAEVRAELYGKYGGTRLGRQELAAELLEDVEGALWTLALIDAQRWRSEWGDLPEYQRVVVAVDPSGGAGPENDEVGIVAAARAWCRCTGERQQHYFVTADVSGHYTPDGWGRRAVGLYHQLKADRLVAEQNYGGEMVEHTLRTIDRSVSYKALHASRGKAVRAEPVAALYEQGRVHHVGLFPALEDEMVQFVPGVTLLTARTGWTHWCGH